jgi:signal transduction histidine kinase
MTNLPVHYKIQKRIGYVHFLICVVLSLLNVIRMISSGISASGSFLGMDGHVRNAVFMFLFGLMILGLSRVNHPAIRMMQVAVFGMAGALVNLINAPWDASGMALLVLAIVLAIQYSFFEKRFTLKMTIAMAFIFGIGMVRTLFYGKIDVLGSLAAVAQVAAYFVLLWIMFSDVLKDLAEIAKDLELAQRKDSVFVRFGRNVAGLVHNLSNMLSVLYSLNALMRQRTLPPDILEFVAKQQSAFDRMTGTLERILAVVRAKQDTSVCAVDLNVLLAGVVEYYRTDFDFKNTVTVDLKPCEGELVVEAQPLELCEVMENLLKNSWEAMKGKGGPGPRLIEINSFRQPTAGFSIRDHGCGIPGLGTCRDGELSPHFQVGRTTKEKGTGLGVPFILEAVKSNGWNIEMESAVGQGTMTTIWFTRRGV